LNFKNIKNNQDDDELNKLLETSRDEENDDEKYQSNEKKENINEENEINNNKENNDFSKDKVINPIIDDLDILDKNNDDNLIILRPDKNTMMR